MNSQQCCPAFLNVESNILSSSEAQYPLSGMREGIHYAGSNANGTLLLQEMHQFRKDCTTTEDELSADGAAQQPKKRNRKKKAKKEDTGYVAFSAKDLDDEIEWVVSQDPKV